MIMGSIKEEDITIVNIYESNIGAPQCIRQTLTDIKGEIESNIIIVRHFNTPLTPMYRSSKQKINKVCHIRPGGHDWYPQNIPSKCRIYFLLECT